MAYLLDANVLITAYRQWYGFDFCPGFRDWILRSHEFTFGRNIHWAIEQDGAWSHNLIAELLP